MPVHCGYCGHAISDEAHVVIEYVSALFRDLLDLVVVLLATGNAACAKYNLAILVGQDSLYSGESKRPRYVNSANSRVRMRAAQNASIEHPRQLDVVGVSCLACDSIDSVDARRRATDRLQWRTGGFLLSHREPPFAAASTASREWL